MEQGILDSKSKQTIIDHSNYNKGDESERYALVLDNIKNKITNLYQTIKVDSGEDQVSDFSVTQNELDEFASIRPDYWRPKFFKRNYSKTIQKWYGSITEINEDGSFLARLKDLTNKGTDEVALIDLEDVDQDDRDLIELGANFYWTIERKVENGQIFKVSNIRFQRLIELDEVELNEIIDSSRDFARRIKFD